MSSITSPPDFTTVTEIPGGRATREQLSMLYTRYHFASFFCRSKKVLEVGCGAGQGLGYLAQFAETVTGIDIDESNFQRAAEHYRRRRNVEVRQMDANDLDFPEAAFDVVILFEALYYLLHPEGFLIECRRVLRKNGILLINTVNPEWQDFNPSPFSTQYFSVARLQTWLENHRFKVEVYGAFPSHAGPLSPKMASFLKRAAKGLGLIPKTMRGKEFLKQIFWGRLEPIPAEVGEFMAEASPLVPISPVPPIRHFKVLYAVAHKREEFECHP